MMVSGQFHYNNLIINSGDADSVKNPGNCQRQVSFGHEPIGVERKIYTCDVPFLELRCSNKHCYIDLNLE